MTNDTNREIEMMAKLKTTTYTILQRDEETACDYCGNPLYLYDRAVAVGDNVYCSVAEAYQHANYRQLMEDSVTGKSFEFRV